MRLGPREVERQVNAQRTLPRPFVWVVIPPSLLGLIPHDHLPIIGGLGRVHADELACCRGFDARSGFGQPGDEECNGFAVHRKLPWFVAAAATGAGPPGLVFAGAAAAPPS